jgi:DNA-binding NarL/FixJ family response regulator
MTTDNQDRQKTGLDDGPPLPAHVVSAWKRERALKLREEGRSLREIGATLDVSYETIRVWCAWR